MYQVRFITLRANIRNKSCTLRSANCEGANLKALVLTPPNLFFSPPPITPIYIPTEDTKTEKYILNDFKFDPCSPVYKRACASRKNKIIVAKQRLRRTSRKMSISSFSENCSFVDTISLYVHRISMNHVSIWNNTLMVMEHVADRKYYIRITRMDQLWLKRNLYF